VNDYMLRMLRREDRRRMSARCTITRGTHPDVSTVATDVECVIRPSLRAPSEVTSGGTRYGLHLYDVRLPYDTDVRRGDVVTVTRSRDPQMAGRAVRVRESTIDEYLTTKTVVAEESVA
jgi:hypothetical protein